MIFHIFSDLDLLKLYTFSDLKPDKINTFSDLNYELLKQED